MEQTKRCTGKDSCGEIKLLSEFYTQKSNKDGLDKCCKICKCKKTKKYIQNNSEYHKEKMKQHYQNNPEYYKEKMKQHRQDNLEYHTQYRKSFKDGKHHVYLLPEVNYVGVTDSIYTRMGNHKHDNNISTTSNYQILHSFENRDHAEIIEDWYHEVGCKGKKGTQNKNLLNNK